MHYLGNEAGIGLTRLHDLADVIKQSGILPRDAEARSDVIVALKQRYHLAEGTEHHTDALNRAFIVGKDSHFAMETVAEYLAGSLIQSGAARQFLNDHHSVFPAHVMPMVHSLLRGAVR